MWLKGKKAAIPTGRLGEFLAVEFLRGKRYTILARNYRKQYGEIDIIARDKDVLVFIEVKTRHSSSFGSPFEAVDSRKQRQISRVAQEYLQAGGLGESAARFDVIAVRLGKENQPPAIDHIQNAFDFAL